jgi:hypothetical protein
MDDTTSGSALTDISVISLGPQGLPGPTGATGAMGPMGYQGLIGPTGPLGPGGATGPPGAASTQGATGVQGIQGIQGATGSLGPTGPLGPIGLSGPTGPKGDPSSLTSDLTVYVDNVSGSDSNAGTQSAPFATILAAWNYTFSTYSLNGHTVIFQFADSVTPYGCIAQGNNTNITPIGTGNVAFFGNQSDYTKVTWGDGVTVCGLYTALEAYIFIRYMTLTDGGVDGNYMVQAGNGAQIYVANVNVILDGTSTSIPFYTWVGGVMYVGGAITVRGHDGQSANGVGYYAFADVNSYLECSQAAASISPNPGPGIMALDVGTMTIGNGFLGAHNGGVLAYYPTSPFIGTATGARIALTDGGAVLPSSDDITIIPGDVDGNGVFNASTNAYVLLPTPSGAVQSISSSVPYVWDMFDRSDRTLDGDIAPSGGAWAITGVGGVTAQILNRQFVCGSGGNFYAYQAFGGPITRIAGTFSFTPGPSPNNMYQNIMTLIADQATDLYTMLHLNFGPTSWGLTKRINGGAFLSVGDNVEPFTLLTDGTVYGISMDIDYVNNTVTVTDPYGRKSTFTDSDIGTNIIPVNGAIQITGNGAWPVGAWNGFSMGEQVAEQLRGFSQSAPMSEIASLKGTHGLFRQHLSATLSGGAGWYTIATQGILGSFAVSGSVDISLSDVYRAQVVSFTAFALYFYTSPGIVQTYNQGFGQVIDQVRISTDSTNFLVNLDVHVQNAEVAAIDVDFYGVWMPVSSPVVGATALPSASTVLILQPYPIAGQAGTLASNIVTIVADLPTGVAAGVKCFVTDATSPAFGSQVVGGGSIMTPVFWNGSAWIVG